MVVGKLGAGLRVQCYFMLGAINLGDELFTRPAPAVSLAELVPDDISSRLFALPMMNKEEGEELFCDIHAWLAPLLLRNIEEESK